MYRRREWLKLIFETPFYSLGLPDLTTMLIYNLLSSANLCCQNPLKCF